MGVTPNKTQGERYKVPCQSCDNRTWHEVVFSIDSEVYEDEIDMTFYESHQILRCLGCDSYSFRKYDWNNEQAGHEERLFPGRIVGRRPLDRLWRLPSTVRAIYLETHAALGGKQPILAGVGIRALVEAVCNEKKAKGRTLEQRIDDLVDQAVLTPAGASVLHGTRILGNQAIHEAKAPTEKMLNAAMEVAEHLLTGVFLLPEMSRRMKGE